MSTLKLVYHVILLFVVKITLYLDTYGSINWQLIGSTEGGREIPNLS